LDDYWVFERGSGEREVLDGGVEGSDVFADIEKSVGNAESDCDVREKKRTDPRVRSRRLLIVGTRKSSPSSLPTRTTSA
jgi:hypothetical protein